MLYILSGSDFLKIKKRIAALTRGYEIIRFGEGGEALENAPSYLGASGLFAAKLALVLDQPLEDAASKEFFLEYAKSFADAEMPVIALTEVDVVTKKKLPKSTEIEDFSIERKEEVAPNMFALADAFASGDRKRVWVLYRRFIESGSAAEELHGILSWQVRAMVLASKTKSASEAGLKPFVYTNAKSAVAKTKTAPEELSRELLALYHKSRMGEGSLENLLEIFLLKKS